MSKVNATDRDGMLNTLATAIDVGGPAHVDVYTGSPPTHPEDAPSGTLLASNTMSGTAFAAASGGTAAANAITNSTIGATGTAGYWRIVTGSGTCKAQGTVTATGGGGSITFDTVAFVSGRTCTIDSLAMTLPEGT